MFSFKNNSSSAFTLIDPNIFSFLIKENDHVTNVIRQVSVVKSVKDDKNFLSAHFIFTFTRISCFSRQSLNPGVVTT